MKEINLQSAFLLSSLFHFVLAFLVWFLLKGKKSKEITIWTVGSMIIFLGSAFFGLRTIVPDYLSYGLARTGTILGGMFLIAAYKMHASEEPNIQTNIALGFLLSAVIELSRIYLDEPMVHFLLNNATVFFMALYLFTITRKIGIQHQSHAAHVISFSFIVLAINYAIRINDIISGEFRGNISNPTTGNIIQLITSTTYNTIAGICYCIMWKDRSDKKEFEISKLHEKEVDYRLLERKIFHLERQKSLGEMSAMITHEISQPLTVIKSISEVGRLLLKTNPTDKAKLEEVFNDVSRNAHRCSQILKRVKQFAKPDQNLKTSNDIRHILNESIDLLNLDLKSAQISLKKIIPPKPVQITCDPIRLLQVFVNITKNAIESIKEKSIGDKEISIIINNEKGNISIEFIDTGHGFTSNTIGQIGTPFFTTKSDGLGLGLSISHRIIEEHGGTMIITNADTGGGSIKIKLPVVKT